MKQIKRFVRRVSIVSVVAALGLSLSPVTADAATTRSKTGYGSGPDWNVAAANAQSDAYWRLHDYAKSLGETCTAVTYSNVGLYYIIPGGGGYVFNATATGTCG